MTDIKPGFVATPMTAGLLLPRKLVSTPERVATDIVRAVERGQSVCYTPGLLVCHHVGDPPDPGFNI